VSETLGLDPTRASSLPVSAVRSPLRAASGVDGVYLVHDRALTLTLSRNLASAVSVEVISVRSVKTGEAMSTSLVGVRLANGDITFAFDSSLAIGSYDLVLRYTFADGSTTDQRVTVYLAGQ
jgi:hypothetical protein